MYRDTEKFKENFQERFIGLLKPHYNDALNYCAGLCYKHSYEDAKDLFQDSVLKALEHFDSLLDENKFRSWFFTIITREFYNSWRKTFRNRFLVFSIQGSSDGPYLPEIFSKETGIGTVNDDKFTLLEALSRLKPKERSAILLYEVGGFSIEEICSIQKEKSLSAVKSRLSRTRKKLREIISKLENNSGAGGNINTNHIGDLENETVSIITGLKAEK